MDKSIDCSVGFMKNAMGSSSFQGMNTTVYCHVNVLPDVPSCISTLPYIEVHWNEGSSRSLNTYFAGVVEQIFSKIVKDDFRRVFVLELWVGVGVRNALMCAFNAAVLALVDAGVPLRKMVYAANFDEQTEGMVLFENDRPVFVHSFGGIKESDIEIAESKLSEIRDIMRFRLENKYNFNFQ
ncbi:Exosomal 3'-5' exoribonuclease complex, subunit Rrp46 [Trachipleistophora hominis]|uniref:Exosomal 3'-5' exoribonuclease complex, subunit Rrp46 n=1 Tax=Trachipleistophora hominis TaxID=72359 RepID=L7JV04_TRAHO|nr:Exosomal 3'-5' exoribonuclease complex, subunit Rrp46 [Trachipleistophora hominis]